MTRPRQNLTEWAESFRKIVELEAAQGFNDRAVIGGLDRFRQRWQSEMEALAGGDADAPFLLRQKYGEMLAERREAWAAEWLRLIRQDSIASSRSVSPEPVEGHNAPRPFSHPAPPDRPRTDPGPTASIQASVALLHGPEPPRALTKPAPAYRLPPGGQTVDDPVDRVKGVNAKTATLLEALDVVTVRDLLYLFPRRHEDYSSVVRISDVVPDRECTVIATVRESRVVTQGARGRRQDTEAVLEDETGTLRAIWFNQRYLARTLPPGRRVAISGKPQLFRGQLTFESPAVEPAEYDQAGVHTGRMVPVYPLTKGINARSMRGFTWDALQNWLGGVEETLPPGMSGADSLAGFLPLREAIFQAHFPNDDEAWQAARSPPCLRRIARSATGGAFSPPGIPGGGAGRFRQPAGGGG